MGIAKKMADAIRRALDDVSDLSPDTLSELHNALVAYDESQSLDLPELPRGEHFDSQMRRETFSAAQMEDYALAARASASLPEGLLIVGDVLNGFTFIGPFECESDAVAYASVDGFRGDWTTATMRAPERDA